MSKDAVKSEVPRFDLSTLIIFIMTLTVPVAVLPNVIDNAFNTPKNLLIF
ncbi:MAG: hypothetical protein JRJ50_04250, partial [Deltaproteobacteria bacterium]|nr:hypothetical protein [Deltaproteobacteria bacterium]